MHILLDYRPALRQRTGVGEFVHQLARALPARLAPDDELALWTNSWRDRAPRSLAADVGGARVIDRRIPVRALTWAWNRAGWPPIERLAGPFDVVHSQTPLLIPSIGAAQVVTIHDLDFLAHPERAWAEMRRDFPVLVREHAVKAHQIIVSSRHAADEVIRQLEVTSDKVSICSPGIADWASIVAQERLTSAGTHILFVGTVEPRKNIVGLLSAYARLRSRRSDVPALVIAGRLTEAAEEYRRMASRTPLSGAVQFRGYVSDGDRRSLYRDAQMLVLPSYAEGFGFPVLEAMACGVPVVISNRGSLPEVAGNAATPVEPDDIDGLAARMECLLEAPAAEDAVRRGFAQAARFSWTSCAASAVQAYRAAIARRDKQAG